MPQPYMHIVRQSVAAPAAASSSSPCHVRVMNSALFQILDIVSKQVLDTNKRVIGTLLGVRSDDGSEFEIRDAFMVPCTESGDSIAIEDHVHKTIYQLYKKAHPKEYVLGWFGSFDKIDNNTGLVHDFYSKGADRTYPFPAIFLNVRFLNEKKEIVEPQFETYIGAAIGKTMPAQKVGWGVHNDVSSYIFSPIPNSIINATETEKLALNLLKEKWTPTGTVALHEDLLFLSLQLASVNETTETLLTYIESASGDDSDSNLDLLRLLTNNLLDRPQMTSDIDALKKSFRDHTQDIIMIEYLTKAIKDQIELSARLTAGAEAEKKVN